MQEGVYTGRVCGNDCARTGPLGRDAEQGGGRGFREGVKGRVGFEGAGLSVKGDDLRVLACGTRQWGCLSDGAAGLHFVLASSVRFNTESDRANLVSNNEWIAGGRRRLLIEGLQQLACDRA